MKRFFFNLTFVLGLTGALLLSGYEATGFAKRKFHSELCNAPKVNLTENKLEVIAISKIARFEDCMKLSITARKTDEGAYMEKAKIVSSWFEKKYREDVRESLVSYGITAETIYVILDSKGQLVAFCLPYRKWDKANDIDLQEQGLLLFSELQSKLVFEAWSSDPEYVGLIVGRLGARPSE